MVAMVLQLEEGQIQRVRFAVRGAPESGMKLMGEPRMASPEKLSVCRCQILGAIHVFPLIHLWRRRS